MTRTTAIAWYVRGRAAFERTSVRIGGGVALTMLSGFNTNFRYRGVLFHVQTEDSGRQNPHVITHLFHGGNIIASEKQEYSSLLAADDVERSVKKMMEVQHRSILTQLSRGEHDGAIGDRLGPDIFSAEREAETDSAPPPTNTDRSLPLATAKSTIIAEERSPAPSRQPTSDLSGVFGDRVVSEKPLDEVVLEYLVENARKRRRQPK